MSLAVFNGAAYGDQKSSVRHQQRKWPPAAGAGQSGRLPATTITYRSKLLSFFFLIIQNCSRGVHLTWWPTLYCTKIQVPYYLIYASTGHFFSKRLAWCRRHLFFDKTFCITVQSIVASEKNTADWLFPRTILHTSWCASCIYSSSNKMGLSLLKSRMLHGWLILFRTPACIYAYKFYVYTVVVAHFLHLLHACTQMQGVQLRAGHCNCNGAYCYADAPLV